MNKPQAFNAVIKHFGIEPDSPDGVKLSALTAVKLEPLLKLKKIEDIPKELLSGAVIEGVMPERKTATLLLRSVGAIRQAKERRRNWRTLVFHTDKARPVILRANVAVTNVQTRTEDGDDGVDILTPSDDIKFTEGNWYSVTYDKQIKDTTAIIDRDGNNIGTHRDTANGFVSMEETDDPLAQINYTNALQELRDSNSPEDKNPLDVATKNALNVIAGVKATGVTGVELDASLKFIQSMSK